MAAGWRDGFVGKDLLAQPTKKSLKVAVKFDQTHAFFHKILLE